MTIKFVNVKPWRIYGEPTKTLNYATLLANRLHVFKKNVMVKKLGNKYVVMFWEKGASNEIKSSGN